MDLLEQVALKLEVKSDTLNSFSVYDPYNKNYLDGFICRQSDHRYGTLVITHVNQEPSFQIVYGTPKIPYPFTTDEQTGERKYHWPKTVEQIKIYEKYDGTNILIYSYANTKGERFVTFKTRLTPIVRAGDAVDFKKLWDSILEKYPQLRCPEEVLNGIYAWSFELFGLKNPILMKYEELINAALLFKVRQKDHQIETPDQPNISNKVLHDISDVSMVTTLYNELREKAKKEHVQEEDGIIGTEGFVFYVRSQPYEEGKTNWQMFKCKPEDVEQIHWANESIDKYSIFTTAMNALENIDIDELTSEFVTELLKEEFNETQITKSRIRIQNVVKEVVAQAKLRTKIKEEFKKLDLKAIGEDKGSIMRALAATRKFDKKQMKFAFAVLREMGVVVSQIKYP